MTGYIPKNEKINLLVTQYREGDSKAGEELLVTFEPLIKKYLLLLWYGKYSQGDKDLYLFLGFFNKDRRMASELLVQSMHKNEVDDIKQILNLCLLQTALRYNKVSAGYKFVVKDYIAKFTRDILVQRTTLSKEGLINSNNGKIETQESIANNCLWSTNVDPEKEAQNNDFVSQGSDLPGFKDLTPKEREVARLAFLDKYPNEDIAKKAGLTFRQVKRYRQKIREKIRKGLEELNKHLEDKV